MVDGYTDSSDSIRIRNTTYRLFLSCMCYAVDVCDLNAILKQYDRETVSKDVQDAIK